MSARLRNITQYSKTIHSAVWNNIYRKDVTQVLATLNGVFERK